MTIAFLFKNRSNTKVEKCAKYFVFTNKFGETIMIIGISINSRDTSYFASFDTDIPIPLPQAHLFSGKFMGR